MRPSTARTFLFAALALGLRTTAIAQCWRQAAFGFRHSAAIAGDNSLWTWGWNDQGQLGDGSTTPVSVPHQVGSANDWSSVAVSGVFDIALNAGGLHSAAIKADGSLWLWGNNDHGQLGDGTTEDRYTPVQVGQGSSWRAVVCGPLHTLALRADSTLWGWGYNHFGQLGLGDTAEVHTPTQAGTDHDWGSISGFNDHSLGLKGDSSLWSWGHNHYYQLGFYNDNQPKWQPTQVDTATDWRAIATGTNYSFAVKGDGTLWGWGRNDQGQLGLGTNSSYHPVPEAVGAGSTWQAVACGDAHTIAQRADGTLRGWGFNFDGELGVGTNTFYYASAQTIPSGVGSASIALGSNSSASLRTDGSLWAWGRNWEGNLGLGDMEEHTVPLEVACQVTTLVREEALPMPTAFPNPTEGALSLDRTVEDLRVFDGKGRLLRTLRNTAHVDLEGLPAACYLLELRWNGTVTHLRVMKH